MDAKPRLDSALVQEFVAKSHGDLDRVRALIQSEPALVNAAWDWGGGDWETGLGAAAHVGRRDIALFLLDHGARLDVFAAAMLGYLDVVQAAVAARPDVVSVAGPHGIPLIAHAKAGGEERRRGARVPRRAAEEVGMTTAPAPAAKSSDARRPRRAPLSARSINARARSSFPTPTTPGTARLLEHLGFEALATTSSGFAATLGQLDNTVGRERAIAHVARRRRRHQPAGQRRPRERFRRRARGCGRDHPPGGRGRALPAARSRTRPAVADAPVYELAHAVERVRAAVEAARSLPHPFVLTARAENLIVGRPDLADTIRRLQAYQEAGADVLFAPGVATSEDIAAVVRSVDRPVNVLIGMPGMTQSFDELQELGVKRISVGSALSSAALGGFMRAAREMREQGTFTFVRDGVRYRDLAAAFRK